MIREHVFAYPYVGRDDLDEAKRQPGGARLSTPALFREWLRGNPDSLADGSTYVVDLRGVLRLAPRRSEHVHCASGDDVLGAGEIRFGRTGSTLRVAYLSNQSAGYCPDVTSLEMVVAAIRRTGVNPPARWSAAMEFRRCPKCREIAIVKDAWFVCVFCEADLPKAWNVSERRKIVPDW